MNLLIDSAWQAAYAFAAPATLASFLALFAPGLAMLLAAAALSARN